MSVTPRFVVPILLSAFIATAFAQESKDPPPPKKLLIAFSSYRDRPKHPNIYFYEHDGVGTGKVVGSVGTQKNMASADGKPFLTPDGRYCYFTFEKENNTSRIYCWDLQEQKLDEMPKLNTSPNAQFGPTCSKDSQLIAFSAWNRPGGPGQAFHVFLYDKSAQKIVDLPGLSTPGVHDSMAALSGDGRLLAFASNRKEGAGLTDIYLYDRKEGKLVPLPGLNSPATDFEPSLSEDGNLIAFTSERPDGVGGRDIYLFDRRPEKLLPLVNLNSPAHEYSPRLSGDGRYLVFVSERVAGEGERDIYLYDRQTQKLLPTPGLNSKTEDFDPCVIVPP